MISSSWKTQFGCSQMSALSGRVGLSDPGASERAHHLPSEDELAPQGIWE